MNLSAIIKHFLVTSLQMLVTHKLGKQHADTVAKINTTPSISPEKVSTIKTAKSGFMYATPATTNQYACTPCKLTLNSQAQIDLHISGIKHKKAVQGNEQMVPNNKSAEIYCEPCGVSA